MIARRGQTVQRAIEVLQDRSREAGNVRNTVRDQLLSRYVEWVRQSEVEFRQLFADNDVIDRLHSQRHWHLRAHGRAEDLAIGPGVFYEELDAQQQMLREVIETLSGFLHLADRPGEILVLDTNTIIHHRPFNEVDWRTEADCRQVRLLIPLLVLDELDAKTYASSKQLAGRAEKRLLLLDQHLEAAVNGGSVIRDGVTLEILRDPVDHRRHPDPDYEVLNRAEFVQQICGDTVRVISGDRGMRVRGISRGIPVQALSSRWRLPLTQDTDGGGTSVPGKASTSR
ncbi:PIN domain-containing protein [Actinoplanes sp. NPDC026619]|uniref:PIN domain-containing protein n=1 Tax=Actinoplanes sp. NPDC026619 TaxID=3155798 RepID=UPI0033C2F9D7